MQLMTYMHTENKWHVVDEAWRAELLPVGNFVIVESHMRFVVEVLGVRGVVWPVFPKDEEQPFLGLSTGEDKLEWLFCFDFQRGQSAVRETCVPSAPAGSTWPHRAHQRGLPR
jgi:hypothetical protein